MNSMMEKMMSMMMKPEDMPQMMNSMMDSMFQGMSSDERIQFVSTMMPKCLNMIFLEVDSDKKVVLAKEMINNMTEILKDQLDKWAKIRTLDFISHAMPKGIHEEIVSHDVENLLT